MVAGDSAGRPFVRLAGESDDLRRAGGGGQRVLLERRSTEGRVWLGNADELHVAAAVQAAQKAAHVSVHQPGDDQPHAASRADLCGTVGTPGVEDADASRGDEGKAGVSGKAVAAGVGLAAAAATAAAAAAGASSSESSAEEARPVPQTGTDTPASDSGEFVQGRVLSYEEVSEITEENERPSGGTSS